MNLTKIKDLLYTIKKADYKDFFAALILNERIDYIQDITQKDLDNLDTVYEYFLDTDATTLINTDLLDYLDDMIEERRNNE